jgi:hypothetical protein
MRCCDIQGIMQAKGEVPDAANRVERRCNPYKQCLQSEPGTLRGRSTKITCTPCNDGFVMIPNEIETYREGLS